MNNKEEFFDGGMETAEDASFPTYYVSRKDHSFCIEVHNDKQLRDDLIGILNVREKLLQELNDSTSEMRVREMKADMARVKLRVMGVKV